MKTIIPFLFLLTSCGTSVKEKMAFRRCADLKSMVVYNKTQNRYIADSIRVNEPGKLSRICTELNNLKEVADVSVNANVGFYELTVTFINGSKYEVDIIYTVYNGVVVRDESGKYYKNDNLESTVLEFFQK